MTSLIEIPLSEIDFQDRSYLFSFPSRDTFLIESIKNLGIIEPPILEKPKEPSSKFKIIAGEGRLLCAKKLGFKTVEAKVLENISPKKALIISFETNLFRKLNLVELALLFKKLSNFFEYNEVKNYFQKIGFKLSLKENALLISINNLIEELKLKLAEERLNPQVVNFLSSLSPFQQKEFLLILDNLNLTFSEQRQVLEKLIDLMKRKETSSLIPLELKKLLKEENFQKRKEKFLKRLFQLHSPNYFSSLERVKNQLNKLKHKKISYELPPGLETKELLLKIKISSEKDLEEVCEFLQKRKTEFKNLLDTM